MKLRILPVILAGLLLAGCGDQAPTTTSSGAAPIQSTQSIIESPRPDFTLPDLSGKPQSVAQWDGKVVLINFWAPWCPPCRKEIPALIELQQKYHDRGFTVVGITLDTLENAEFFLETNEVNYPLLLGEEAGFDLTLAYGNRLGALPYSALIDRQGKIRFTKRSELTFQEAEQAILPYL